MCGIFGIVNKDQKAAGITYKGLLDIEYRGYDSWGVAYFQNGNFSIKKQIGFLPKQLTFPGAEVAIGHTRWATHGGVTEQNAHPHTDCTKKIVLVHNGIIENFLELRKELKGHKLVSETDTEIAVHLIEEALKKEKSLTGAVSSVFKKLEGLNALVVSDGRTIVAVKKGSPIVAGNAEEGSIVASDPNAILPHTKELLFLEDNDLVDISDSGLKLFNALTLKERKAAFTKVDWQYQESDLADFPHFMLKEIFEQPKVLRLLAENWEAASVIAIDIDKAYGTFFLGCGTASYACLAGVYLFSKIAKKHVNFSIGSEFTYIEDYIKKGSLVAAISQSGETIDVVEPFSIAKKKGATLLAMTNVLGSTLYRMADKRLMLLAGPEKAVCGTKSFVAMVANMILLSFASSGNIKEGVKILEKSAAETEKILKNTESIKKLSDKIYRAEHIYVLGRGLSYPLALETALKIKEISYIHAEGFAGGELKHGVIALIEKGTPVIVFVPRDETKSAILASAMEVKARGAFVIGIGEEETEVFDYFFKVEDCGASSIIPHVVFSQLLAYYLTVKLKLNPDKPRNLAKSVVVK
jgi:glutamine---fructose-6-phosphate transaminase (isomerizing)